MCAILLYTFLRSLLTLAYPHHTYNSNGHEGAADRRSCITSCSSLHTLGQESSHGVVWQTHAWPIGWHQVELVDAHMHAVVVLSSKEVQQHANTQLSEPLQGWRATGKATQAHCSPLVMASATQNKVAILISAAVSQLLPVLTATLRSCPCVSLAPTPRIPHGLRTPVWACMYPYVMCAVGLSQGQAWDAA